jgi:glycosyltransferase involved in cell wall biosynthesis
MTKSVVFLGPTKISGIGQVTRKWANVCDGDFVELGYPLDKQYDVGVAFVIPLDGIFSLMKQYERKCTRMIYYTICETDPVNESYGKILELSDTIYTSSQFCADVFKKQFGGDWRVIKLYAFPKMVPFTRSSWSLHETLKDKYVFYHIGNIVDQRKNMNMLIDTFVKLGENVALVLKATCRWQVSIDVPNVHIINEFLSDDQMEELHEICDCYVSCSHSEGAGMGAVEAAIRNKPVIIQEYGATKEYIQTPWLIPCTEVPVGSDDFLFKKDHTWGMPDQEVLLEYMVDVSTKGVKTWDHSYTHDEMEKCKMEIKNLIGV